MEPILVAFGATDLPIPKKTGTVRLIVEFPTSSNESVLLHLNQYQGTQHVLSRVTSYPCGPNAIPSEELDNQLNKIHRIAFGDGGWLNMG